MKGYLSIREAAEKWGVSERRVNQYCVEGRIPGVQRFGTSWAIPDTANKPGDPRKNKTHEPPKTMELYTGFMPLMSTSFAPGKCMETIEKIPNRPKKEIALAEYYYFSGQAEKAMQKAELYLTYSEAAYRFSACLIYAYACLSMGQISHARYALKKHWPMAQSKHPMSELLKPLLHRLLQCCFICLCRKKSHQYMNFCLYCRRDCVLLPCMSWHIISI